jgi:hypothetical protein
MAVLICEELKPNDPGTSATQGKGFRQGQKLSSGIQFGIELKL